LENLEVSEINETGRKINHDMIKYMSDSIVDRSRVIYKYFKNKAEVISKKYINEIIFIIYFSITEIENFTKFLNNVESFKLTKIALNKKSFLNCCVDKNEYELKCDSVLLTKFLNRLLNIETKLKSLLNSEAIKDSLVELKNSQSGLNIIEYLTNTIQESLNALYNEEYKSAIRDLAFTFKIIEIALFIKSQNYEKTEGMNLSTLLSYVNPRNCVKNFKNISNEFFFIYSDNDIKGLLSSIGVQKTWDDKVLTNLLKLYKKVDKIYTDSLNFI
jgi:hypothetical protein